VNCPSCSSEVATDRRFCPSCGTPLSTGVRTGTGARAEGGADVGRARTAGILLPDGVDSTPGQVTGVSDVTGVAGGRAEPYPAEPYAAPTAHAAPTAPTGRAADPAGTTRILAVDPPTGGRMASEVPRADGRHDGLGDRLAPAGDAVRRRARALTDRYRAAPADVRLALVGAVVTVVGFLLMPYAAHLGTAAAIGGRLWWRPLAAVVATVLVATAAAPSATSTTATTSGTARGGMDRLLAAVVVATAGATEAGLVGIVSGDADRARLGYFAMLAGLVVVLFATVRAARRRCAG
jgi:hypothetical protein